MFWAFGTEEAGLQALAAAGHFEGVGQRVRLLEDFLLHVVVVGSQFDGVGRELRFDHRTLDGRAIDTGDADGRRVISAQSPLSR